MIDSGHRILVTGGAGFIGTALATRNAAQAASWVAFDNLLPQVHGDNPHLTLPASVDVIKADIRDRDALATVVVDLDPTVVLHLAAETGTGQSLDEPSRHTDVNVTGTAVLLEALASSSCRPAKLVLTSSRAVYGEGEWVDGTGEVHRPGARTAQMLESGQWDFAGLEAIPSAFARTRPAPSNIYGATKLAQEHLVSAWCAARGVSHATLRLQNVYGPGQSPLNPYTGITTLFMRIAGRGEVIPVYEDGRIVRDFVYIDDVARALESATNAPGDVSGDVGSGVASTIHEMADIVASFEGAPAPEITGQFRLGDVRHAACDMSDSAWLLAGQPATDLATGLRQLHSWMSTNAADNE